jgi:hypothetical protein
MLMILPSTKLLSPLPYLSLIIFESTNTSVKILDEEHMSLEMICESMNKMRRKEDFTSA